jgi:hypothetical protein
MVFAQVRDPRGSGVRDKEVHFLRERHLPADAALLRGGVLQHRNVHGDSSRGDKNPGRLTGDTRSNGGALPAGYGSRLAAESTGELVVGYQVCISSVAFLGRCHCR